ncbi:isoaspartyl peptidase/L-asparaginase [Salinibaculum rarum]|uniref:isoaspartyl peptidase/L-asparaginase n=1 Tax=Salinibaculum rarum TaxID=3058903 RepID=UPI002660109D|nr:isoaspartyl peptidase/L-asparaginase [Salinibaculum sp. KK48]
MDLLVHGGAGSAPDDPHARQTVLDAAAAVGVDCERPVAAVTAAVRRLEADPQFNAGVGSAVQSDGVIRTDAGLMTSDGSAGAAGAMAGVKHAIDVARVVKRETPHVLVVGEPAVSLADSADIETACDLWTERTRERWRAADPPDDDSPDAHLSWAREHFGDGHDTVGAVATDGRRLAAATSTGGRWFALAGRVGDVPQVGAGFYATPGAAVSTTGDGEAILRFGLARRVADAVADGESPQHAADRVLRGFATETGGGAGVIVIGADGQTGTAYNTDAMQTAKLAREDT